LTENFQSAQDNRKYLLLQYSAFCSTSGISFSPHCEFMAQTRNVFYDWRF